MRNNNTLWLKENINMRGTIYMNKKHNSRKMMTPSRTEQKDLVAELNEVALYLYMAYIDKAYVAGIDLLDDAKVGKSIGWTARKVKDNRLKLQSKGWIYFNKTAAKGITFATWALGRDKVTEYKLYGNEFDTVTTTSTELGTAIEVGQQMPEDTQLAKLAQHEPASGEMPSH